MINLKSKWMVGFFVGMISITYFGTLLTVESEVKLENNETCYVESYNR